MTKMSWKVSPEVVGLSALVAGDVAAFASGANPSIFTVRTFRKDSGPDAEHTREDIYIGMFVFSALGLIVGAGAGLLAGSWWPIVTALLFIALFVVMYRWALANPHNRRSTIADQ